MYYTIFAINYNARRNKTGCFSIIIILDSCDIYTKRHTGSDSKVQVFYEKNRPNKT